MSCPVLRFKNFKPEKAGYIPHIRLSSCSCLRACVVQGYYDLANLRLYLLPVCCFGLNSIDWHQSIRILSSPFCYFLLFWFYTSALTFLADSIILTAYWRSLMDPRVSFHGYLLSVVCSCRADLRGGKMLVRTNNLRPDALTIPLKTLHVWCVLCPCRQRNGTACISPESYSPTDSLVSNLQKRLWAFIPACFVILFVYLGHLVFGRVL